MIELAVSLAINSAASTEMVEMSLLTHFHSARMAGGRLSPLKKYSRQSHSSLRDRLLRLIPRKGKKQKQTARDRSRLRTIRQRSQPLRNTGTFSPGVLIGVNQDREFQRVSDGVGVG